MAGDLRQRVLDATYAEVAERGLGGLAIEAVAVRAGSSRATIYRHFPGGRDELVDTTLRREVGRVLAALVDALPRDAGLHAHVCALVAGAHRLLAEHEVFQRLVADEAEVFAPSLANVHPMIHDSLRSHLGRVLRDSDDVVAGLDVERAADHGARMALSYVGFAGRWDLRDPADVESLVRDRILPGVLSPGPAG